MNIDFYNFKKECYCYETESVPSLLVGGPNPFRQDKCNYKFTEIETAFTDHVYSNASIEIAINLNALAVYLFSTIAVLLKN